MTIMDIPSMSTVSEKNTEKSEKTLKEFESAFLQIMLEIMFKEVSFNPMKPGSQQTSGDDIHKSWMIEQYAKNLVENRALDLAHDMLPSFLRLQENSQL